MPFTKPHHNTGPSRRGVIIVLAAVLLIVIFAFLAFSIDVGYMTMTQAQLQNAADAAAMAGSYKIGDTPADVRLAAKEVAYANTAAGAPVVVPDEDIDLGIFDYSTKTFVINETLPNAVRVRTRVVDQPLFFAPVIKHYDFDMETTAIAMLNPRDIVFVVDLSGSMNDDTEPCWATQVINEKFTPLGYPSVANPLMEQVFADFGYGTYPGSVQYIGAPLGVSQDDTAFAEMTQDDGPLADDTCDDWYRVREDDDEYSRREKCYRWIIDKQIAVVMPNAKPTPDSTVNYGYWEKYIDYIMDGEWVGNPPPPDPDPVPDPDPAPDPDPMPDPDPPPPEPPIGWNVPVKDGRLWAGLGLPREPRTIGYVAGDTHSAMQLLLMQSPTQMEIGVPRRGSYDEIWVPWYMDGDRIEEFNNPNEYTFPGADQDLAKDWRNWIGYITYVQFMMDWGRDRSPDVSNSSNSDPDVGTKTPLSVLSEHCPRHTESVSGYSFNFPPREQPMHAVRRSLIAALAVVADRNMGITPGAGDRVALVTYDGLDAYHTPQLVVPLTSSFSSAMSSCVDLQSTSDIGSTTATEAGLLIARNHLKPESEGGAGRHYSKKVIVLLTDGVPNAWSSSQAEIDDFIVSNPGDDYYHMDYVWLNAALVQAARAEMEGTQIYAVGMGLGTDYDFMDRMARTSNTDEAGMSVRGSGNPAEYEQRLTEIFTNIIRRPGSRLVE
ncbi:MAG: VWA domain-containing protein [Planctomycetaceae bacterium]